MEVLRIKRIEPETSSEWVDGSCSISGIETRHADTQMREGERGAQLQRTFRCLDRLLEQTREEIAHRQGVVAIRVLLVQLNSFERRSYGLAQISSGIIAPSVPNNALVDAA